MTLGERVAEFYNCKCAIDERAKSRKAFGDALIDGLTKYKDFIINVDNEQPKEGLNPQGKSDADKAR